MTEYSNLAKLEIDFKHIGKKNLEFFIKKTKGGEQSVNIAIVYGANGAGKSSIARAISENCKDIVFRDKNNNVIPVVNDENIFVYNEDFIEKNFRSIESDSITPIVILGEKVAVEKELKILERKMEEINQKILVEETKLKNLKLTTKESWDSLRAKIYGAKGSQDSWKARSSKYNPSGQMKQVREKVIERIINTYPKEDVSALYSEFEKITSLLADYDNYEPVKFRKPFFKEFNIELLEEKLISLPQECDSNDFLMQQILEFNEGISVLKSKLNSVFSQDSVRCPSCYQVITDDYKISAVSRIESLINRLQNSDKALKISSLKIDENNEFEFSGRVDQSLVDKCQGLVDEYNGEVRRVNSLIQEKIDNPNKPITAGEYRLPDIIIRAEEAFENLKKFSEEENSRNLSKKILISEAEDINYKISSLEIAEQRNNWQRDSSAENKQSDKVEKLKRDSASLDFEYKKLLIKLSNREDGAKHINDLLKIVYGADGMRLDVDEKGYKVLNRGSSVSPGYLSTGEKNILSLCYFFVSIANNKSYNEVFNDNSLIVLDDPVSSFDFDNKYGVIALLGYMIREIFPSNAKNKLLILTHDITIASDLNKISNSLYSGRVASWAFWDGDIKPENFDSVDIYCNTLKSMYTYAFDENLSGFSGNRPSSNEVRRVWEAFVTFELGEKLTDATSSNKVISYVSSIDGRYKKLISIYQGRIFANPDSHGKDQVRYFNFDFIPALNDKDFKRYVQETLCIMHILSSNHIPSRIAKDGERLSVNEKIINKINEIVDE